MTRDVPARRSVRHIVLSALLSVVLGIGLVGVGALPAFAGTGYVHGQVVDSSSNPIVGQSVSLEPTGPGPTLSTATDGTGHYAFDLLDDGDYTLTVPASAGYIASVPRSIGINSGTNDDEAPITLNRYGVISGNVEDIAGGGYFVDFPGSTIDVYADVWDGSSWNQTGGPGSVDGAGDFSFEGIVGTGLYRLEFVVSDELPFFTSFFGTGLDSPEGNSASNPGIISGTAETDVSGLDVTLVRAGYISGIVKSGLSPIAGAAVFVSSETGPFSDIDGPTDATGSYRVKVPAGDSYTATAIDTTGNHYPQTYSGFNFCACVYTPIPIGASIGATASSVNFNLLAINSTVVFDYLLNHYSIPDSGNVGSPGVDAHLYASVTGGYHLVNSSTSDVDGYGYLVGETAGKYRLRFSSGSDWVAITSYVDDNGDTQIPDNPCYVDVSGTQLGDYLTYDFLLDPDSTATCGSEPVPPTPPSPPGVTHHKANQHRTAQAVVESTFSPTTTPTPTPSPSASEPTASPSPTPNPVLSSAPNLTWLVWLLIVVGILIIGGIAFFVVRRR